MLICVETDASRESGAGETVTPPPASEAETFSFGGTQLGEIAGSWNLLAEASGSAPAPPEQPVASTSVPASRIGIAVKRSSGRAADRGAIARCRARARRWRRRKRRELNL
jgi:hypothetical protein